MGKKQKARRDLLSPEELANLGPEFRVAPPKFDEAFREGDVAARPLLGHELGGQQFREIERADVGPFLAVVLAKPVLFDGESGSPSSEANACHETQSRVASSRSTVSPARIRSRRSSTRARSISTSCGVSGRPEGVAGLGILFRPACGRRGRSSPRSGLCSPGSTRLHRTHQALPVRAVRSRR